MAAWLPTNWANGVTMIGYPSSARTCAVSSRLVELVFFAHDLELVAQIGNHPAGHLMAVPRLVVFARHADGQPLAFGDAPENARSPA